MPSRKNLFERKQARQEAAKVRQAERDKRTNQQQIKLLTSRGHEHCKEIKRLKNES